jgi:hypothetical protein
MTMTKVENLDQPPSGWFVLDVMKREERGREWVAPMVDIDPDDIKNCTCEFPSLFYVRPDEYRAGSRHVRQCWVRIAGKHRSRNAAHAALQDMIAIRH